MRLHIIFFFLNLPAKKLLMIFLLLFLTEPKWHRISWSTNLIEAPCKPATRFFTFLTNGGFWMKIWGVTCKMFQKRPWPLWAQRGQICNIWHLFHCCHYISVTSQFPHLPAGVDLKVSLSFLLFFPLSVSPPIFYFFFLFAPPPNAPLITWLALISILNRL